LEKPTKVKGVIFSDLGRAASFMAFEWVQRALKERLGFVPYPATLNLRPNGSEDLRTWETVRKSKRGIALTAENEAFCSARLFPIEILRTMHGRTETAPGAVLLPEVDGYPQDKIEVIAPVHLKNEFGVRDGDELTLEFVS
jgi:riboflavin kinase, archaea type